MLFPGHAVFRMDGSGCVAVPRPGISAGWIRDTYHRTVLPLALQAGGLEVLHASGVVLSGQVVALCARSGVGKSTTAAALHARGAPLWADDAVVWRPASGGAVALPVPFRLHLRSQCGHVRPGAPCGSTQLPGTGPLPLGCVVLLRRSLRASTVRLMRLTGGRACRAVLEHALCFSLEDEEARRRLAVAYLTLAAEVPVLEARFAPDIARVGELAASIERAAERLAAEPRREEDGT